VRNPHRAIVSASFAAFMIIAGWRALGLAAWLIEVQRELA
jgi:hypothetical protein